jgi:hypothetical protein
MAGMRDFALAATCTAMLALGVSACGGGSSSGSSTAATTAEPSRTGESSQTAEPSRAGAAGRASPAAQGSASFIVPGGDNSVQRFGSEAPGEEREAASRVVVSYMRARAAKDYGGECAALARSAVEPLQRLTGSSPREQVSCVNALSALAGSRPAPENPMTGPIGSLRVQGDSAFALFHGRGGVDYTISMRREGPIWKVATLEPVPLN